MFVSNYFKKYYTLKFFLEQIVALFILSLVVALITKKSNVLLNLDFYHRCHSQFQFFSKTINNQDLTRNHHKLRLKIVFCLHIPIIKIPISKCARYSNLAIIGKLGVLPVVEFFGSGKNKYFNKSFQGRPISLCN